MNSNQYKSVEKMSIMTALSRVVCRAAHRGDIYCYHFTAKCSEHLINTFNNDRRIIVDRITKYSFFATVYVFLCLKLLVFRSVIYIPTNMRHSHNAVSMLGHRRRRWASIETAFGECHAFVG